jgi:MarR family transcriptional regulator, multiple antibiotic resistance protein MarR
VPKPLRFLSPIHKAYRQVGTHFERVMGSTGVAPQEGHILSYLRSYAPCPIAEVVTVFGLRGSTATAVLDRLEDRGLIRRRPNPDDRRSLLLELTADGRRVAEIVQGFVDALETAIGRRISRADEEGFHAVMKAIEEATQVVLVERKKRE